MTLYLADSSIWSGRRRTEAGDLSRRFVDRLRRSEIATCVPVALEVLTGPADGEAYVRDWTRLWGQLHWLPLRERATGRALEVQSELALAAPGAHRRSLAHFLIAACAEDAGPEVVLWHWDPALAAICEHTGQQHELVTPPAQIVASRRSYGNGGARPALIRPPEHAEGA